MKNKYSEKYEKIIKEMADVMSFKELIGFSNKHFSYKMNESKMRNFLYKRNIKCKDYHYSKVRNGNKKPLLSEYVKADGMVLIKVAHPSVWEYKQRYIYEKYHGSLPKDNMVIFLDGNRTNYDIDNLMAVSTAEYNYIKNKGLISCDRELTKAAILSARLDYKTKEIKNENIYK